MKILKTSQIPHQFSILLFVNNIIPFFYHFSDFNSTKMGKRRHKKRTHVEISEDVVDNTPKSMVIKLTRRGHSNTSLNQLVHDFRQVMQPHTAIKLRERSTNKLKDFISMTGPLGVSHLMVFSISDQGNTNLRICRSPRGPTMQFRVIEYSLCKDISKILRAPKSPSGILYSSPPLLVLNGFTTDRKEAPQEALLTSMFQNMFPPISVQDTKVSTIKRVMILNKDPETEEIELRHYAIETKMVDVSNGVRRLTVIKNRTHRPLPNLNRALDISELITDPYSAAGFTSESEIEDDALVEIEQRKKIRIKAKDAVQINDGEESVINSNSLTEESKIPDENEAVDRELYPTENVTDGLQDRSKSTTILESLGTQKRAIKLVEIGPRLKLKLRKIEEGMGEGKVLYHSYIKKTDEEIKALESRHLKQQQLKAERRRIQDENVKKKESKSSRMKRGKEKAKLAAAASASGENNDSAESFDKEPRGNHGNFDSENSDMDDDDELFASDEEEDSQLKFKGSKKQKLGGFDDLENSD